MKKSKQQQICIILILQLAVFSVAYGTNKLLVPDFLINTQS